MTTYLPLIVMNGALHTGEGSSAGTGIVRVGLGVQPAEQVAFAVAGASGGGVC